MTTVLVAYGTGEGQTADIADRIADVLRGRDTVVETVDVDERDPDPDAFDAVVVGSSIHLERQHPGVVSFVTANRDALAARPTAFFQVSLSDAVDDPERRAEAARYVDDFLEDTGWHPDRIGRFGGALRYSKYGFLKRLVLKQIARDATGDVDTSRDYEYTDWDEVDAFAADFLAFAEGRLGTSASDT
ncbi:MAG: flavodoxin domain-containing protein [Halarchaeum sp.]